MSFWMWTTFLQCAGSETWLFALSLGPGSWSPSLVRFHQDQPKLLYGSIHTGLLGYLTPRPPTKNPVYGCDWVPRDDVSTSCGEYRESSATRWHDWVGWSADWQRWAFEHWSRDVGPRGPWTNYQCGGPSPVAPVGLSPHGRCAGTYASHWKKTFLLGSIAHGAP